MKLTNERSHTRSSAGPQGQDLTIELGLDLSRPVAILIVVGLLSLALLAALGWGYDPAAASSPSAPEALGMRKFYLTKSTKGGAIGSDVCASGYHMASLWEILDPSQLEYDTVNGYTQADSGNGPPSAGGWVKTGYLNSGTNTPGMGNCSTWSTTTGYGTRAFLPDNWITGQDLYIWEVDTLACNQVARVWCVED